MMQDDPDLDGLFKQAAAAAPLPSAQLLARVAADAAREQPRPGTPERAKAPAPRGWAFVLADVFGGTGGLAGLTFAAVSGLWIGVAQPAALSGWTDYLGVSASMELLPSDAALLAGE
ncbi:dihydroorotate dehydrogenase [Rhodobacter sp. KR11]|uniref:dihydroorotate dehydrogenase n=1 Tax=Rhodobacter sp. KR11 TaxID=2974588 RepID=UPI002221A1E0|nr:dihydroorotate dehydrogenase [Rhodobacter sp. KR11]MCW1919723.1 dihydroorotate dehydrogenase [Rhodobacter sp. KR11]